MIIAKPFEGEEQVYGSKYVWKLDVTFSTTCKMDTSLWQTVE